MLDNFQDFSKTVTLICPFNQKKINVKKIYNLHSNKKIKTISIFKKKFVNSFLKRLIFSFKIAIYLKKRKGIILTRSLISSFAMTIFNVDHFLEIHQEIKGLTKLLMVNLDYINSKISLK